MERYWMDVVVVLLRVAQTATLAAILYVLWWDVNHGVFPIGG